MSEQMDAYKRGFADAIKIYKPQEVGYMKDGQLNLLSIVGEKNGVVIVEIK